VGGLVGKLVRRWGVKVGVRGHVEQHCAGCVDLRVIVVVGAVASGCESGGEETAAEGQDHGQLVELGTAEEGEVVSDALSGGS
jgi:hypothetical protein